MTMIIDSGFVVDNIDLPFRVFAGPGAGKTYWLVNHIRHVLKTSKHVNAGARVACISYTVVAAEEIIRKLDDASGQVQVSTIHSFLYTNIVKPYVHMITRPDGNPMVSGLHSVEEHHASPGKIRKCAPHFVLEDMPRALKAVENLTWNISSNGELKLAIRDFWNYKFRSGKKFFSFPNESLLAYKQSYWDEGRLHHEDVLYFSYRILSEYPDLTRFLAARYPYIFLDEFQDTTPIQTWLIRRLSEHGTTVGVIGDAAQSIYKFIDARVEQFVDFRLPGQVDYIIDGNRRSTHRIVGLLNAIRGEQLTQYPLRRASGDPVTILVGDARKAIEVAKRTVEETKSLCILARRWDTLSTVKGIVGTGTDVIWDELRQRDSSKEVFLRHVVSSLEFANIERFDLAIDEMSKIFRARRGSLRPPLSGDAISDIKIRTVSMSLLKYVTNTFEEDTAAGKIYNDIQAFLKSDFDIKMVRAMTGKFKQYSDTITCAQLMRKASNSEGNLDWRTIHQAKGAEFDAVMVLMDDIQELMDLFGGNIEQASTDEPRLRYVALSRARDCLFISVPTIEEKVKEQLQHLDMVVTTVT